MRTALLAAVVFGLGVGASWWVRGRPTPRPAAPMTNRGEFLYRAACQVCHGPDGHGDGTSAAGLMPPPRDFAAPRWRYGATPEAVRWVIRHGLPGTAMPGSPSLSEADLDALTAFVLTLASEAAKSAPPEVELTAVALRAAGFTPLDPPRTAPALRLPTISGERFDLAAHRGTVVLLHFWGTSCPRCPETLPLLETAAKRAGLLACSVCCDAELDAARNVAGPLVKSLPVLVADDDLTTARFDVQVFPTLMIIDPAGRIVGTRTGMPAGGLDGLAPLAAVLKGG